MREPQNLSTYYMMPSQKEFTPRDWEKYKKPFKVHL